MSRSNVIFAFLGAAVGAVSAGLGVHWYYRTRVIPDIFEEAHAASKAYYEDMMGIKSAESVKNEEKTAKNDEKLPKSDDLRPKNSLYDDIIDDLNKGRVRGSEVIDYTKFSSTPAKKEEVKEPKKVLNEHAYLITEDEYSDTHPEYDKKICIFKTDPEYDYQVFNAVNYEEEPDWGDWISKDVIQAALELEEGDEIWMRNESYGLDVCLIREES